MLLCCSCIICVYCHVHVHLYIHMHFGIYKVLLQSGADPRLTAEDGERPDQVHMYCVFMHNIITCACIYVASSQSQYNFCQVASNFEVESVLNDWKIDDTERLLEHVQVAQKKRMESHGKLVKAVGSR